MSEIPLLFSALYQSGLGGLVAKHVEDMTRQAIALADRNRPVDRGRGQLVTGAALTVLALLNEACGVRATPPPPTESFEAIVGILGDVDIERMEDLARNSISYDVESGVRVIPDSIEFYSVVGSDNIAVGVENKTGQWLFGDADITLTDKNIKVFARRDKQGSEWEFFYGWFDDVNSVTGKTIYHIGTFNTEAQRRDYQYSMTVMGDRVFIDKYNSSSSQSEGVTLPPELVVWNGNAQNVLATATAPKPTETPAPTPIIEQPTDRPPEPTEKTSEYVINNDKEFTFKGERVIGKDGKPILVESISTDEQNWVTGLDQEGKPMVVINAEGELFLARKEQRKMLDDKGNEIIVEVGERYVTDWPYYYEWDGKRWLLKDFPLERFSSKEMSFEWIDDKAQVKITPSGEPMVPETVTLNGKALKSKFNDTRFEVAFIDQSTEEIIAAFSTRTRKVCVVSSIGDTFFGIDLSFRSKFVFGEGAEGQWRNVLNLYSQFIRGKKIEPKDSPYILEGWLADLCEVDYVPPGSTVSVKDYDNRSVTVLPLKRRKEGVYDFAQGLHSLYLDKQRLYANSFNLDLPRWLIDTMMNGSLATNSEYIWDNEGRRKLADLIRELNVGLEGL